MGIHRPPVVMPDMKRRRASTGEKIETIMNLARRLPLTRQILADQLANATPTQMEFVEEWIVFSQVGVSCFVTNFFRFSA